MPLKNSRIALLVIAALVATLLQGGPVSAADQKPSGEFVISTDSDKHEFVLNQIRSRGGSVIASSSDSGLILASISSNFATGLDHLTGVTVGRNQKYLPLGFLKDPANPSLDRIDQRDFPGDKTYTFSDTQLGAGVNIYVIDSGVQAAHPQFGKRVLAGASFVNTMSANGRGPGDTDCGGHGTHVAGIAAGLTTGVAPKATIIPVQIFGCSTDAPAETYRIVNAIDWVIDHHKSGIPAVINMSIGGPKDLLITEAINRAIEDGITVVAAAGNDRADACEFSPANAPGAITVGAMGVASGKDSISFFSNHGTCVDIFAPGGDVDPATRRDIEPILSANSAILTPRAGANNGLLAPQVGTSMAAPFVAGAAARYLSFKPSASPEEVTQVILSSATKDSLTDSKGSSNLSLYVDPAGYKSASSKSPAVPTNVTAAFLAATSMLVSWKGQAAVAKSKAKTKPKVQSSAFAATTGFTITATSKGVAPVTMVAPAKATSVRFVGLESERDYRFTVSARAASGETAASSPSNPIKVAKVTPKAKTVLASAPTNFSASSGGTNHVQLTWNEPAFDGGSPILMYLISVTPFEGVERFTFQETSKKVNSFEFRGLNSGVEYTFKIQTITAVGESTEAAIAKATPSGQFLDLLKAANGLRVKYNNGYLSVQWTFEYVVGKPPPSSWQVSLIDASSGLTVDRKDVRMGLNLSTDFASAKLGHSYKVTLTAMAGPIVAKTLSSEEFVMSKTLLLGSLLVFDPNSQAPVIYTMGLGVRPGATLVEQDVTIEWTNAVGIVSTGYYISWRVFDDVAATWSARIAIDKSMSKYTITGLRTGSWMIRIENVTDDGVGSVQIKVDKTK